MLLEGIDSSGSVSISCLELAEASFVFIGTACLKKGDWTNFDAMRSMVCLLRSICAKALLSCFIISGFISCGEASHRAPGQPPQEKIAFDSTLATMYGADDYGKKNFVLAYLRRGNPVDLPSSDREHMEYLHYKNVQRLIDEKKIVLSGQFGDQGDLLGLYIYDADMEEAQRLVNSDPAIQADVFDIELMKWYGPASLIGVHEIHPTIAKVYKPLQ